MCSPTFTLPTTDFPSFSAASSSMTGPSLLQGGQPCDQKSTKTGFSEPITSASNESFVNSAAIFSPILKSSLCREIPRITNTQIQIISIVFSILAGCRYRSTSHFRRIGTIDSIKLPTLMIDINDRRNLHSPFNFHEKFTRQMTEPHQLAREHTPKVPSNSLPSPAKGNAWRWNNRIAQPKVHWQ